MQLVGSPIVTNVAGPLRALTDGDPAVRIAIIDGPIDVRHPCFAGCAIEGLLDGWCAADAVGPAATHGTHVASLLLGRETGDWSGLAPACKGLAVAVFSDGPEGQLRLASQQSLAHSISLAAAAGADIINVSAGRQAELGEADAYLVEAVAECRRKGALVVAAAGNEGCSCHHLPAILPDVLVVGALGSDGLPLAFSNWGSGYRRNGVLAPGLDIVGATPGGGFAARTGTSFAAAVVTGIAALLLSLSRKLGLALRATDIRDLILATAAPCPLANGAGCEPFLGGAIRPEAASQEIVRRAEARGRGQSVSIGPSDQGRTGGNIMSEMFSELSAPEPAGVQPVHIPAALANDQPRIAPSELAMPPAEAIAPLACACKEEPKGDCGCGCGGAGKAPQKVYALGALWYDFGTEARFDALQQVMSAHDAGTPANPEDLVKFLKKNPIHAQGLAFTLNQEATPIYAILPAGPYAPTAYEALLDALDAELKARKKDARAAGLQRVSLPGFIIGKTRLANHMEVPVVGPDLRGMFRWTADALVAAVKVQVEAAAAGATPPPEEEILNFLSRVYYELRNLGVAPEHRAINYAATNAYQAAKVFEDAAGRQLALDTIGVVKSPVCRPDSDCWDVDIRMFDPENDRRAARVYRFTVDVSEVIPVTVGAVRSWAAR